MTELVWSTISVPMVDPAGWTRGMIRAGLAQLERLTRETAAATARLVSGLGVDGRDTPSEIARATGVSAAEGRRRTRAARTIEKLPALGEALAAGAVSPEHVQLLGPVADRPGAEALVAAATTQSPEALKRTIDEFLIGSDNGDDLAKRQHEKRSVRFFDADLGMVGIHAVLPPLDGALIRAALNELADRAWRAKHPDREPIHDPNVDEPLDRRLADALIEFFKQGGSGQATADDRCRRPRATVVVTLGVDSGRAEVVGQGQVPLRTAFDLVSEPGVELYGALLGLNGDVLAIGKDRRFPTLLQRIAVILRDKHCVVPGCAASHDRCEIHHLVEIQRGGKTVLANLALLCPAHHHFLHNNHYELRRGPTGYYVVDATGTTVIPP